MQMKQIKLRKTIMLILNWKKPFGLKKKYKNVSAL